MRCPDCNRFVAYADSQEPECEFTADADGAIEGEVIVTLGCAECGTELKQGTFNPTLNLQTPFEVHKQAVCAHTVTVSDGGAEEFTFTLEAIPDEARPLAAEQLDAEIAKARTQGAIKGEGPFEIVDVEGPDHELEIETESEVTSRTQGKKTFYGHRTTITVACSCGEGKFDHSEEIADEMLAAEMDEA